MAKKSAGVTKSQAIRDYYDSNPKAKPKEVAEELGKQGVDVSPQFVSTIRSVSKKKTVRKRGRPAGSTTARKPGRPKSTTKKMNDEVSIDSLLKAKKIVNQFGSVGEAKAALDALAKLID